MNKLTNSIFCVFPSITLFIVFFIALFFALFTGSFIPLTIALAILFEMVLSTISIVTISESKIRRIRCILFAILSVFTILIAILVHGVFEMDLIELQTTAKSIVTSGKVANEPYFSRFSFQRNWTMFLSGILYITQLFTNSVIPTITVFNLVNAFLIIITCFFSIEIAQKLWGEKAALLCTITLLLSPSLMMYAPFYYTDIFSTMCAVIVLYLLILNTTKSWILSGVFCALGCSAKFTTIIPLIAGVIILLIVPDTNTTSNKKLKNKILLLVTLGLSFIVSTIILKAIVNIIPWNDDPNYKYSMAAYFLTGLTHTGTWNPEVMVVLDSHADKAARDAACWDALKYEFSHMSFEDVMFLMFNKINVLWGDGFTGADYYINRIYNPSLLSDYIYYSKSAIFKCFAQAGRITILVNLILGCVKNFKNKIQKDSIVFICLFGFVCFYAVWEVHPRALITFLPIAIIASMLGVSEIESTKPPKFSLNSIISVVSIFAAIVFTVALFSNFKQLAIDKTTNDRIITSSHTMRSDEIAFGDNVLSQTFTCYDDFNQIDIYFYPIESSISAPENSIYSCEILDSANNVIRTISFDTSNFNDDKTTLSFDKISVSSETSFKMNIQMINPGKNQFVVNAVLGSNVNDYYELGQAECNVSDGIRDIDFEVINRTNKPLYSPVFLITILLLVWGTSIIVYNYSKQK